MISTLAITIVAAAACSFGMRGLARRYSLVADPNPIVPQHREPVPYLGGLGVAGGILCGLLFSGYWPSSAILVGAVGMLAIGLIDDLAPLEPKTKLLAQSLVTLFSIGLGLGLPLTGYFLIDHAIIFLLVIVWVNAVNLTDVCDGLVSSLVFISMLGLSAIDNFSSPLPLIVGSACLGFLIFNWPPASMYLGDSGSNFLGFLLAALTLEGLARTGSPGASLGIVACSSVFIFEFVFLFLVRLSKGIPWWRGSPDHFSLRMQAGPFTRTNTLLLSGLAGIACAGAGWLASRAPSPLSFAILALLPAAALLVSRWLLRWPVDAPNGDPR